MTDTPTPVDQITEQIATALNETNPSAKDQIYNLLKIMGVVFPKPYFKRPWK